MRFSQKRTIGVLVFLLIVWVLTMYLHSLKLLANLTSSMPEGIYRLYPTDRPLARGDIVQICMPSRLIDETRKREQELLAQGRDGGCVGGTFPLLKFVAAVGGDVVDLRTNGITINGAALPYSVTQARDHTGAALTSVPRGRYVVAPSEIWLWSPFWNSWDSRYFGPVEAAGVRGFAREILTAGWWTDWSSAKRALSRIPSPLPQPSTLPAQGKEH